MSVFEEVKERVEEGSAEHSKVVYETTLLLINLLNTLRFDEEVLHYCGRIKLVDAFINLIEVPSQIQPKFQ